MLRARGIEVSQSEILAKIGQPTSIKALADFLNGIDKDTDEVWFGEFIEDTGLLSVLHKGSAGAVLQDGSPLGHLVMIDGIDKEELFIIKDPFDGTSYKMTEEDFLKHWGLGVVFKWKKEI